MFESMRVKIKNLERHILRLIQGKLKTFHSLNTGFAVLFMTILVLVAMTSLAISITVLTITEHKISRNIVKSNQAYYVAEAGIEDSIYRIIKGKNYGETNVLSVGEGTATISITTEGDSKVIKSSGEVSQRIKRLKAHLIIDTEIISFHYGVQVDRGGLQIQPNARVIGNVYSNGSIKGSGSTFDYTETCHSGDACITGDAWVAGGTWMGGIITYIDKTWIGVDAHANTISNSNITGDAYYQYIENTTVYGTSYPGSPDPATKDLPISYAQIQDWERVAEAEEIIEGSYAPPDASSLGPIKINGNLTFPKNGTVIIEGPVWVTGKILAENNVTIKLKEGLAFGYPIIADNPSDQAGFGQIELNNNVITQDTPEGGRLLFISTNKSSSISNPAIWLHNNVNQELAQSIVFSLYGLIKVENNVKFKEITGYAIYLANNAEVVYEEGLMNSSFSSGPGAGWKVVSWQEIE